MHLIQNPINILENHKEMKIYRAYLLGLISKRDCGFCSICSTSDTNSSNKHSSSRLICSIKSACNFCRNTFWC